MPRLFVHKVEDGHFYIDSIKHDNDFDFVTKSPGFVVDSFASPLFDSLDLSPGESCAIIIYRDKRERGKS